jgi:hypothetical protein
MTGLREKRTKGQIMTDTQPPPLTLEPKGHVVTLWMTVNMSELGTGLLVAIEAKNGGRAVEVRVREAGTEEGLRPWDGVTQNYLSYPESDGACRVIEAEVWFEGAEPGRESMRVGVPVALIGGTGSKELFVRVNTAHVQMFVDGVLVDEDWPVAPMRAMGGNVTEGTALPGEGRRVSVHDAWLSDQELADLCGGAEAVARREVQILGPEREGLQYWRPRGHNTWAGDTMLLTHEGVLHVFYLLDRRHGASKFGCGAHQIAHVSTRDLRTWEHHPMAVAIEDENWLTCGTGLPFVDEGRFYLFYGMHTDRVVPTEQTATPMLRERLKANGRSEPVPFGENGKVPMGTTWATSTDGTHWEKSRVMVHPSQNPSVIKDDSTGGFYLLAGYGDDGLYSSRDLRHWATEDRLFLPHGRWAEQQNTLECQCHFEWHGWHYMLSGRSGFWMARDLLGPYWDRETEAGRKMAAELGEQPNPSDTGRSPRDGKVYSPRWDIYDGLWVPMVSAWGDRRILSGWITGPGFDYAGYLVFRELIAYEDGTLGAKWVDEMIPASGPKAVLQTANGDPGVEVRVAGQEGFACMAFDGVPNSAHISLRLKRVHGDGVYGICFAEAGGAYDGCELKLSPHLAQAQWGTPRDGRPSGPLPTLREIQNREPWRPIWDNPHPHLHFKGGDFVIESIEGLESAITIEVILLWDEKSRSTLVDACIDGRRTMITRRPGLRVGRLWVFGEGAEVEVAALEARPLI